MKRKNSNKNRIFLSVTALLLILLVGVGFTYSWIEGGTTYSIFTEDSDDVKTGAKPSKEHFTDLEINPEGTDTIDLGQFDKTTNDSQSLTFSEVSSVDGENFYFPTAFEGGIPTAYRKSNTNDIGTKFINFDFDADVSQKCYLAFNGAPTFTLTKNGQTIADTSAFRIMIKSGEERRILTTATEAQTSTVVTDVNGTTATLTAESVDNYTYNLNHTKKLFEYEQGDTPNIEVSVWLDGETANSELLRGSNVTVDMKLIAVQEKYSITFDAVTYDNSGNVVNDSNAFTGGKIKVGTTDHSKLFIEQRFEGDTFTAKATPNSNYTFDGWYADEGCTTKVSSNQELPVSVSGAISYYAKFIEKPKYTVSAEVKTVPEDQVGGTVKVNNGTTSATDYKDATVTLTATANDSYRFDGWYTDEECNTPLGNSNKILTQTVTVGSSDATYYAKFVKEAEITFIAMTDDVQSNTGGNVKINNGTAAGSVTTKVDAGSQVTLTAVKTNDKASLLGIYDSSDKQVSALTTYTFTADSNATYYAKFKITSVDITFTAVTDGNVDSFTGGSIAVDSTTYNAKKTLEFSIGASVSATATAKQNYEFKGWYTDSACTQSVTTTNGKMTVTASTDTTNYYAKFVAKKTTITVYLTDNKSWGKANCHYWGGSSSTSWPGKAMTKDSTNSYGETIYMIEIPDNTTGIVFNNGSGEQTVDITDFSDGTAYYLDTKSDKWTVKKWDYK